MQHIQHIFFDLDGTLWDFRRSSRETLTELFDAYRHHWRDDLTFGQFIKVYRRINEGLWKQYERNEINSAQLRVERWEGTFRELGIPTGEWTRQIGEDYIHHCPRKPYLLPQARETLDYLATRFPLHVITNGFSETQAVKMTHANLYGVLGEVITSDDADSRKPDRRIFEYALQRTGARAENSLYIGDNYEADVLGGAKAGLSVIFYNPLNERNPEKAPEIKSLEELRDLF